MKRGLFAFAAGGILFAAALVGYLFVSRRPATLRVAVGPPKAKT
jgi:hypothetical protein